MDAALCYHAQWSRLVRLQKAAGGLVWTILKTNGSTPATTRIRAADTASIHSGAKYDSRLPNQEVYDVRIAAATREAGDLFKATHIEPDGWHRSRALTGVIESNT